MRKNVMTAETMKPSVKNYFSFEKKKMATVQQDPYSPTAWEFISSQLGTKSAVQEKDAGWGDWLGYKGRDGDLIPDWLVGSGGMLYDSDYDAAGNLAGIFGTAGSLAGTTGGAALGSAVGPAGTVAGGAGGSAAGGMAGRGLGSALGNSWLGKGLNSITGSGSQNKEKLDPATWKQVVVDTAFGGVLPGAGMALNAGRAAASKGAARKILLNNMAKGKPSDAVTRRVDRLLTAFPKWNQRAGLVTKKLYPNQLLGYGTAGQAAKGIAGKSARSLAASAPATLAVGAGLRGLSGLSGSPSPNGLLGGQEFANRKTNPFSDPMTTPGVTNVVSGDATYRS
jgi:hypothetical protein